MLGVLCDPFFSTAKNAKVFVILAAMKPQKPATPANMYFLAHLLPAHLNEPILQMKQDLQQRFGCTVGLKSPAHITLIPPFWLETDKAPQLLPDLQRLATSVAPFYLAAANFSSFGKRTLFIAVAESSPLQQLKAAADSIFTGNDFYALKMEKRPFHPHITLATRDIKPAQFDEAWAVYGGRRFDHQWQATSVSIFKHNRMHWEVAVTAALTAI
jgi:2'-5' RNA ligase